MLDGYFSHLFAVKWHRLKRPQVNENGAMADSLKYGKKGPNTNTA